MKPITVVLIALLIALVTMRTIRKTRAHKVFFGAVSTDQMSDPADREKYRQFIENSKAKSVMQEDVSEYLNTVAMTADPEAQNQAVVYDRENDLIIVSSAIVARVAAGDVELWDALLEFMDEHPAGQVLVSDFEAKIA